MLELAWSENFTFIFHILSSELGNTQSPGTGWQIPYCAKPMLAGIISSTGFKKHMKNVYTGKCYLLSRTIIAWNSRIYTGSNLQLFVLSDLSSSSKLAGNNMETQGFKGRLLGTLTLITSFSIYSEFPFFGEVFLVVFHLQPPVVNKVRLVLFTRQENASQSS